MGETVTTSAASRPQERSTEGAQERSAEGVAWLTTFSRRASVGLVAGLAILPGALAVFITFFYLGDWPTENPFDQVFYGVIVAVGGWLVFSVVFLRGLSDVQNGDSAAYDELVMRAATLKARIDVLGAPDPVPVAAETREKARLEAEKLWRGVDDALQNKSHGSAMRWAAASGYTSLWRQLHRAEEALLASERKESLYAEAVDDEARLTLTKVDEAKNLGNELRRIFGDPKDPHSPTQIASELDTPEGRALLRKIRCVLNSYRDDLFQRFVRIRNAMFATLVYVGLVFDGLLALAMVVAPPEFKKAIAVAIAYFLVGALVGLFAELYGASKGQRGAVHDYGLALVRLLTIPVLSGIAAVLGVLFTRLGAGVGTTESPVTLDQIFSLQNYPLGIVVAAIFGLTPGLLLERLRAQTNEYKDELMKSAAGTPGAGAGTTAGA